MNPLHLMWIIPLCTSFGYALGAVMATGNREDDDR